MATSPYHIARQEHLGNFLDLLARRGILTWQWGYDNEHHRAIWTIQVPGGGERVLDTRDAEKVAVAAAREHDFIWLPVPHPGGERAPAQTLAKMRDA